MFLGLISYSLYLWHWPVLVFSRLYLNRELTTAEAVGALLAAFAASVLSWRFIEQPIRRRRGSWRGVPASFPIAVLGGAALAALAAVFLLTDGLPLRVPSDVRAVDAQRPAPKWCNFGDASSNCRWGSFRDQAVLWGDSHARALVPGLIAFAAVRRLSLHAVTRSSCPPLPGLSVAAPGGADFDRCDVFNRDVLAAILKSPPRLVILEARWEVQFNEHRIRADVPPDRAFAIALGRLLDAFGARHIPVLVIGNVPRFGDIPGHCYGRERMQGRDPSRCLSEPWSVGVDPLVASERLLFQAVVPRTAFARYHPVFADLCDREVCHAFLGGHLLYGDEHHLSPAGAALIGQRLDAALRNWPR